MSIYLFLLLLSPLAATLNAELHPSSSSSSSWDNVEDRVSLLSFKAQIRSDPRRVLDAWNDTVGHCQWPGILCDAPTSLRVSAINLAGMRLAGPLSPSLANLSSLDALNLQENAFFGTLPPELGRLSHLKTLNLSFNSLTGSLPDELTNCTNLRFLNLQGNRISGMLLLQFGRLSGLVVLNLQENLLGGTIPHSLGNLTSINSLRLSRNRFVGTVPETLGGLSNLISIRLSSNNLEGELPPPLYNVSASLVHFSLSNNRLVGSIAEEFGLNFPNIRHVLFGGNSFSGNIPASITNASHIELLDLSQNNLGGNLPEDIGLLSKLRHLNLERNKLTGGAAFLLSLNNCTHLESLSLYSNNMTGVVPEHSLANLSTDLSILLLGENKLYGNIPRGIDRLINLRHLNLRFNFFSGSIPSNIGKLVNLRKLSLLGNSFSGVIPASIGNLSSIIEINLGSNHLWGTITPSIGNLTGMHSLSLDRNLFNGSFPKSILVGIANLTEQLDLSDNSFSGTLPPEVGLLAKVQAIDVSGNRFSGNIPESIGNCTGLQSLNMAFNSFGGPIPQSLSQIRGIMDLDLSHNKLSGEIPEFLAEFQFLWWLNLSFNDFHGRIPQRGVFMMLNSTSFMGNPHLCGSRMNLPPCIMQWRGERNRTVALILAIAISVLSFLLILLALVFKVLIILRKREFPVASCTPTSVSDTILEIQNCCKPVSYKDLYRATDGFSEGNLMGIGTFSRVYRGVLGNGSTVVAVKVLDPQQRGAAKSFLRECEALRGIRHRNVLKIITLCSSVDLKGNDFLALVLQFMPNGSLERWLHPLATEGNRSLNFTERVRIATDVAFAVDYLHNGYSVPIVHCDLKPGNVLLDKDMIAHVGDFGLARCLPATQLGGTRSIHGSFGYISPEYAMGGQVTTEGDIYSFGILLLEIITGKRPTDDLFVDGLTLTKFASMEFPGRLLEIVDPSLLEEYDGIKTTGDHCGQASGRCGSRWRRCLVAIIRLGLHCAAESPRDRPNMGEVVKELEGLRSSLLGPFPA